MGNITSTYSGALDPLKFLKNIKPVAPTTGQITTLGYKRMSKIRCA